MKIPYKNTIVIDETRLKNLPKNYIKEQVRLAVNAYITHIENNFGDIKFLLDENAEREKK